MGFRFHRRLALTRGLGVNLSKSGPSFSLRSKAGTIGIRGFSIRSGIPGFYFRKNWGKSSGAGAIVGLVFMFLSLILVVVSIAIPIFRLVLWLFIFFPFNLLYWLILTVYDIVLYLNKKDGTSGTVTDKDT